VASTDRTRALRAGLLALPVAVLVAGCAGEVVSTSPSELEARYDTFVQAELSPDADSGALVEEYGSDPLVGPVRGGGSPGRLLVFVEPTATGQQVEDLAQRLRAESGVQSVAVRRGVEPPELEVGVPGPAASELPN